MLDSADIVEEKNSLTSCCSLSTLAARYSAYSADILSCRRGATLVVTSFTCTAPFVGALLGSTASAGLHVLLKVSSPLGEAELIERIAAEGVRISGASACYHAPPAEPRLLVGFSGTPTEQIDEGVARLVRFIEKEATRADAVEHRRTRAS